MPQIKKKIIETFDLPSGLRVWGHTELNNRQRRAINGSAMEIMVKDDGTQIQKWNPYELPYVLVLQWLSHPSSGWDLRDERGDVISHNIPNIEEFMPPGDFDDLSIKLLKLHASDLGLPSDILDDDDESAEGNATSGPSEPAVLPTKTTKTA